MSEWHYEYITRVTYVQDGDPWPFAGAVLVAGEWIGRHMDKKIIRIEPYRAEQGGGGGGTYSSYHSHSDWSIGLAVWWIEQVKVDDAPPPPPEPSNYDQLREELQV